MRRGSRNERTRLAPTSVTTESSETGGGRELAWGVWPCSVCHVGFCNGSMINEEEQKMLLGIVGKNEEC